jgi:IS1 family transposase
VSKNENIASTIEMDKRKEKAQEFYDAILDSYEHPWLVTDEASLYDITLDEDDDLIERIYKFYGYKIESSQLSMPFWKLLDLLENKRTK